MAKKKCCSGCESTLPCEACLPVIINQCEDCPKEIVVKSFVTIGDKIVITYTDGRVVQFDFCPTCPNGVVKTVLNVTENPLGITVTYTDNTTSTIPFPVYFRPNLEPLVNGNELGVADYKIIEHRTGEKWIDNKDLYRQVVVLNNILLST